jgi:hypothetical protein
MIENFTLAIKNMLFHGIEASIKVGCLHFEIFGKMKVGREFLVVGK